jgi:hypothetical protein
LQLGFIFIIIIIIIIINGVLQVDRSQHLLRGSVRVRVRVRIRVRVRVRIRVRVRVRVRVWDVVVGAADKVGMAARHGEGSSREGGRRRHRR